MAPTTSTARCEFAGTTDGGRHRGLVSRRVTDTSSPLRSHLRTTADAYDSVAVQYADFVRDGLDGFPLDRAMFAAFAEYTPSGAPVADVGCGPGYVAAHLHTLGLSVFGVDLSPSMIAIARERYPHLRFEVGSMDALAVPDGSLGGVVSEYSLIHLPPHEVPSYLAAFRRTVMRGGTLMLAFFESEQDPVTPFDHKVVTAYRWPVDEIATLAAEAGFDEIGRMLREPHDDERFRRARLLLRAR